MVDFTKLAKPQVNTEVGNHVSNSNVRGEIGLDKFDQMFSRINLDGFESNLKSDKHFTNQNEALPEQYANALSMRSVQDLSAEIDTSLDYIRQNEQYTLYQNKIKDLLKVTGCENVGDLLSKHSDSKKVLEAMTDLQQAFDADPMMKHHYRQVLTNTQKINKNLDNNRNALDMNAGPNGSMSVLESDRQHLIHVKETRGSVLNGLEGMDIPFVDDGANDITQNLRDGIKSDEQAIQKTNEYVDNQPKNTVENTVESPTTETRAEPGHRKDDDGLTL
jgi:hypothetical protein